MSRGSLSLSKPEPWHRLGSRALEWSLQEHVVLEVCRTRSGIRLSGVGLGFPDLNDVSRLNSDRSHVSADGPPNAVLDNEDHDVALSKDTSRLLAVDLLDQGGLHTVPHLDVVFRLEVSLKANRLSGRSRASTGVRRRRSTTAPTTRTAAATDDTLCENPESSSLNEHCPEFQHRCTTTEAVVVLHILSHRCSPFSETKNPAQ